MRDPQCRQHAEKLFLHALYKANIYAISKNTALSNDLEILFEIYKHYDRKIFCAFDSFDIFSQNRLELRLLMKSFFSQYPNDIDLRYIISIDNLVDQESLSFSYDAEEETLTCKVNNED